MDRQIPATIQDALMERLQRVDRRARLICVLDPDRRLKLSDSLTHRGGTWAVVRYAGNDLAFRATYAPEDKTLVWITHPEPRPAEVNTPLRLHSLADVISQADAILDLSLTGVLAELLPNETWPPGPMRNHGDLFAQHLGRLVAAHDRLRRYLPAKSALDASAIRALALHCHATQVPVEDLLFRQDTPSAILDQYIALAWATSWGEQAAGILREQAGHALARYQAPGSAWLEVSDDQLAVYVYLYRFLAGAGLPHVSNHARGLGLLGFDPEPLEPQIGIALDRWERDAAWRNHVVAQAEEHLTESDVGRVVDLLDLSLDDLPGALQSAEAPALAFELAVRFLRALGTGEQKQRVLAAWRNRQAAASGLAETTHSVRAKAIIQAIDALAYIENVLACPRPDWETIANAIDWFTENGAYLLELTHARAANEGRQLPGQSQAALSEHLQDARRRLDAYLEEADHALANLIRQDVGAYLASPRCSTNVLRDTILGRGHAPKPGASTWIVVFDGMRWDTWSEVVKPRLQESFEISQEKAYLCLLPSWTFVARGGLLAGRAPQYWAGYRNAFTGNQALLAARALGVAERDQSTKLRFHSRVESDRTAQDIDPSQRFPYNVLVFNISDDNLHSLKSNLDVVNRAIESMLREIIGTLHTLIQPDDVVILASDHGFAELRQGNAQLVREDSRWQRYVEGGSHPVTYRYVRGVELSEELPNSLEINYKGMPEGRFAVAIGATWFQRSDSRGAPVRYAHGGLSFAEMVVPGAIMRRITVKRWEISIAALPSTIVVEEGQVIECPVQLANTGNQTAAYELTYRSNTDDRAQTVRGELMAGQKEMLSVTCQARYRESGKGTQAILLELSYGQDRESLTTRLSREIPVTVTPQKGKVEFSLGGFDDLDG